MTNGRVEVITSVERRRRWSAAEKERLVAASLAPGASVSALAREAGIHPGQLYGWRRPDRQGQAPQRSAPPQSRCLAVHAAAGAIEIEFASGARMRITGAVAPATVTAAVAALAE